MDALEPGWSSRKTRAPGKTASYFVAAGRRRPLSLRGPVFVLAGHRHHDDQDQRRDPDTSSKQATRKLGLIHRSWSAQRYLGAAGRPRGFEARPRVPGQP